MLAKMFAALASTAPDATADARSQPCFCRNRICAAMPPTAGTARFENDIDSWSSLVRQSGSRMGTVPISDTAVATLVPNEMISASGQPPPVGARDRVPELGGITDLAQQREDRDQRADGHEQARGVDARQLLQRRRLDVCRRAHGVADLAEQLLEVGSRVTPARPHVVAQRRRLQERAVLRRPRRCRAPRARPVPLARSRPAARGSRAARRRRRVGDPEVDAAVASVKSMRTTPSAPSTTCCVFSRPCAMCAACKRCTARQRSVSTSSVTRDGSTMASRVPSAGRTTSSAAPGPAVPATIDLRHRHVGAVGEEQGVGLVLDVLQPREVQRRPAVLVEEEAPELGQELRVGLVATEHADAEWPVVVLRDHERAAPRLGVGELDVPRVDPELRRARRRPARASVVHRVIRRSGAPRPRHPTRARWPRTRRSGSRCRGTAPPRP